MEVPEVTYATDRQRIAIEGGDEEIYPHLEGYDQSHFKRYKEGDLQGRLSIPKSINLYPYQPPGAQTYSERPKTMPFTRQDLQDFHGYVFEEFKGLWSVHWASDKNKQSRDIIHPDGWRSVILFRTLEFMIRPKGNFKNRPDGVKEPRRVRIEYGDVQDCLQKALEAIDDGGMGDGPLLTFMGGGYLQHPDYAQVIQIPFQWRIDRALPERVNGKARMWKYKQFTGGAKEYHEKKKQYDTKAQREAFNQSFLQQREQEIRVAEPGGLFRKYVEPRQPEPHEAGSSRPGKRSSMEMSASQELSPSSKRRSVGSQSSYGSRSNEPQSLTTSPDMGRGTPLTGSEWQAIPRDVGWGRSVSSHSSVSSQSGLARQSLAISPEMGRQTPVTVPQMPPMPGVTRWGSVAGWENQRMLPPPTTAYGYTGTAYGVHPLTQAVPAQYGSASTGYQAPTAPAQSSYASYTANYPSGTAGMAPPMLPFLGTTGGSWGGTSYPATPPTSSAATNPSGVDPFQFLDPSSVPAPGGGNDVSQYQDTSAGAQPGWWDEAGNYIRSNHPYHGDQSGHQGQ